MCSRCWRRWRVIWGSRTPLLCPLMRDVSISGRFSHCTNRTETSTPPWRAVRKSLRVLKELWQILRTKRSGYRKRLRIIYKCYFMMLTGSIPLHLLYFYHTFIKHNEITKLFVTDLCIYLLSSPSIFCQAVNLKQKWLWGVNRSPPLSPSLSSSRTPSPCFSSPSYPGSPLLPRKRSVSTPDSPLSPCTVDSVLQSEIDRLQRWEMYSSHQWFSTGRPQMTSRGVKMTNHLKF